jgi:flagellar hook-associated protein 2
MIQNDLRITGLASGLDTESIVKKLMDAERVPLNKVIQTKKWQEWQRDAYREVNTKLLDLRTSMQNLRLQSAFNQVSVSSSDSSKIDVKQNGSPSQTSYTISEAKMFTPGTPASVKFGAAGVANDTTQIGAGNGFEFQLNGKAIQITDTDTIQSTIAKINALSAETGITASYSSGDNALVFIAKDSQTAVSITGVTAANKFNITNGTVNDTQNDFGVNGVQSKAAENGQVTINGVTLTIKSNDFTFDGIRYSLKSDIPAGSNISISQTVNVDGIFNNIKSFVDKYNEIVKSLNGKLQEKRYRDFPPLLDEQRKEMKENEITLWEEKAKSGLLQNDALVSQTLNGLRNALTVQVSGAAESMNTLYEIGISPSTNYRDNGILTIDETKLKSAIQNNPEEVKALFTKLYDTGNSRDTTITSSVKFENSGIAWRLYDQLNQSISKLTQKAGSSSSIVGNSIIEQSLKQLDQRIDQWETRLQKKEEQYWKKFTEMEKAMSKANSQSSWLFQQLGGGQ